MTLGAAGINGSGRGWRLLPTLVLAGILVAAPATAQMFSDRPPPVPPAEAPDPSAPAMNLAPPSGPSSIPSLPAPLSQPSVTQQPSIAAAVPPVVAPPGASPGQAV